MNDDFALDEKRSFFRVVYQNSMLGQTVVDRNFHIVSANNQMFQYIKSKPGDPAGLSFGSAFSCAELRCGRFECGESGSCARCGIRKALRKILLFNMAIENSVVQYSFYRNNRPVRKWFRLNGSRITYRGKEYAVLTFTDVTDLKQRENRLKAQLTLDFATGTMNKCGLIHAMRRLMDAKKESVFFTACMIDFDNFKEINDQYGHLMGDKVLEVFSAIARKHMRAKDILGRFGGEEFILVFYEADEDQSLQILQRIHKALKDYFSEDLENPVTFSAGVIFAGKGKYARLEDLLGDVDGLLYWAKRCGRGRAMCSGGEILFYDYEVK